jgi:DNA modification methylase
MAHQTHCGDCTAILKQIIQKVDLTFLAPPFNLNGYFTVFQHNI